MAIIGNIPCFKTNPYAEHQFLESEEAAQAMGNPQFQFCDIIDLIWFDYLPRPPEYLEKWGTYV